MKSSVFSDITPHNPVKVNGHLGETYSLHIQNQKLGQARNQHEADSNETITYFLTKLIFI
jgi:hypothetical protein